VVVYRLIFAAAAAYNIAFGLWASLFPRAFFNLFQLPAPRYPAIWACLGMVVGLYGVGYAYAAWRLNAAFPFIAIGLAGKVLGPIGWTIAVRSGELPFRTFPLIVFDDLIWWVPFSLFLLEGTPVAQFFKRTAPQWCAALHIIAAGCTLLFLREFDAAHPERWRAGWILWMIAAISLAGFYAWWGARIGDAPHPASGHLLPASGEKELARDPSPREASGEKELARDPSPREAGRGCREAAGEGIVPFAIAALGLLCDFSGESIFIGWLPIPGSPLERTANLLTGGAGNGLYTIAGIMLTVASPSLPLRWLAWLAWASGIALTVVTILDIRIGVVIASAALMIFFIPWVLVMGRR